MTIHFGRAWEGHAVEDNCPCLKAPCGLVEKRDDTCDQHAWDRTIRQVHEDKRCPARLSEAVPEFERAVEAFFSELDTVATRHRLNSAEALTLLGDQASSEAFKEWTQETWEFEEQA